MSSPNSFAQARVLNQWGSTIRNVKLNHRYDNDHFDAQNWAEIAPSAHSSAFSVGFWTGFGRTGSDFWFISFEAEGRHWFCKDSFDCALRRGDRDGMVTCRIYKDGDRGKMEVICPDSGNCTVRLQSTVLPVTRSRPVYIIGHRCNDVEDVGLALSKGCNALECDVRYSQRRDELVVDHDYSWDGRVKLHQWLAAARAAKQRHRSGFALIIFDCKFANFDDNDDLELYQRVMAKLRLEVHNALNRGSRHPINIIYSIGGADRKQWPIFESVLADLSVQEGVAIDANKHASAVERYFQRLRVQRCWYGYGVATVGARGFYDEIERACRLRDDRGALKKVYVWTLARKRTIRQCLNEAGADAVMVNVPGTLFLGPNGLHEALEVVNENRELRLAKRSDNPFVVFR